MPKPQHKSYIYEFQVEGHLGSGWAEWFDGLSLRQEAGAGGQAPITTLSGPIADQPTLHGVLAKIRDLNLPLILVRRILEEPEEKPCQEEKGD